MSVAVVFGLDPEVCMGEGSWRVGVLLVLGPVLGLAVAGCPAGLVTIGDDDDTADDDDATGCGAAVEEALAHLEDWTAVTSCADVHVATAPDEAGTVAVTIDLEVDGQPYDVGDNFVFDLPSGSAWLAVETGENLLHYDCNDALWLEEVVTGRWEATAGTATLTVTEVNDEWDVRADLDLQGITVTAPAAPGSTCDVPGLTLADLRIGWLPG